MNLPVELKKSIIISLLGHIALFSIFSLSFGRMLPNVDYTRVNFWGQYLESSQVGTPVLLPRKPLSFVFDNTRALKPPSSFNEQALTPGSVFLKPGFTTALNEQWHKSAFSPALRIDIPKKRQSTITLHPVLPYDFRLYFKDRQVAHVELEFRIDSQDQRKSIIVKRKVSSGNLDADLVCVRNISQYLFRHQENFPLNEWQTVRIELSAQ